MNENLSLCEHCGARLIQGANFCESCGKQVSKPPTIQPAAQTIRANVSPPHTAHARPRSPSSEQAAPPKRSTSLWLILALGGCLGFLCVALLVVGAVLFMRYRPMGNEITNLLPTEPAQIFAPTGTPALEQPLQTVETPLAAPTMAAAQVPEPTQTDEVVPSAPGEISQETSETYFSDDFSTESGNWANVQEEFHSFGIEDGRYALHLRQEDYSIWAYLPAAFTPNTIGFDAAVLEGHEQGAYGVMCHYQDTENYHFISIDPLNKDYSIGYVLDDEYIPLMENFWMPSNFLNDSPYAANNILISCEQDMVTLFINNELEAQVPAGSLTGGKMAICAETWEEMAPNGFKVLFDDLFAFVPVQ